MTDRPEDAWRAYRKAWQASARCDGFTPEWVKRSRRAFMAGWRAHERANLSAVAQALASVCPGCHAVGGERCLPGCIDEEMRREAEDEQLYGRDDERLEDDDG